MRNYYGKEKDAEVISYVNERQRQGINSRPGYSICVNGNYFISVDKLLFPCSREYSDITKHFGGSMNVEYHSGVTITDTIPPLDNEYQQLIKFLDAVDTSKDERQIGKDLIKLLKQKGIQCEYQGQGIDIRFWSSQPTSEYTNFGDKGCELKKKFPPNVRNMYLEFAQILKYLSQESLLSCLLINVQSREYFRVSEFYLGNPIPEIIDITYRVQWAIDREICDKCPFKIAMGGIYDCGYQRCSAYKLRDFVGEKVKLTIKWVDSTLLLQPKDAGFPKNQFLDVNKRKWVLLDSENQILSEEIDPALKGRNNGLL